MKRWLRISVVLIFIVELFVFFKIYFDKSEANNITSTDNAHMQIKIIELEKEVAQLQCQRIAWQENSFEKERVARQELQMARPDETIYFIS